MARPALWNAIADTLREEIARGQYLPGAKLPSEARLSDRFGVNRHTVRRALACLSDEDLIRTRRGAGAFVAAPVTDYPLGRRVRFRRNLLKAGRTPERHFLALETRHASDEEAEALGIARGSEVDVCEGVSLADGGPIALFHSTFPPQPGFLAALEAQRSVTRALAACGINDYFRASTRLTAVSADAAQAVHLQLPPGSALLRAVAINTDSAGRPVEYGRTHFAGDRVTLTLSADDVESGSGEGGTRHSPEL